MKKPWVSRHWRGPRDAVDAGRRLIAADQDTGLCKDKDTTGNVSAEKTHICILRV